MNRGILKLQNIPKASAFRLRNLAGVAKLRLGEHEVEARALVNWQIGQDLTIEVMAKSNALVPWASPGRPTHELCVVLESDPFEGWLFSADGASVRPTNTHLVVGEECTRTVRFIQSAESVRIAAPDGREGVHFRYWVPNFVFEAVEQRRSYRRGARLDAFSFSHGVQEFVFRQAADHASVCTKLNDGELIAAITSVLEVRNVHNAQQVDEVVQAVFFIMEAYEGKEIRPAVRAGYDEGGNLVELLCHRMGRITFPQLVRSLMWNALDEMRWRELIEGMLPGFLERGYDCHLPTSSWQMVEARPLCVPSYMGLLLFALESMATAYLAHEDEPVDPEAPIDHKLHRCNKVLRCFPKRFTGELRRIYKELRCPLFHTGRTDDKVATDWRLMHDLLDACGALMAAICGYRGRIGFTWAGWKGLTVDEYASGMGFRW